jgi:hypothetical protein
MSGHDTQGLKAAYSLMMTYVLWLTEFGKRLWRTLSNWLGSIFTHI